MLCHICKTEVAIGEKCLNCGYSKNHPIEFINLAEAAAWKLRIDKLREFWLRNLNDFVFSFETGIELKSYYPKENEPKEVIIPYGTTAICAGAFSFNDKITSVVLPETVHCVGKYAFLGCSKLEKVTLSTSVSKISEGAFQGCFHLSSLCLPASLNEIEDGAFRETQLSLTIQENNPQYDYSNGCLIDKEAKKLIYVDKEFWYTQHRQSNQELIIPEGIEDIGDYSIYPVLAKYFRITLPNGLKRIGNVEFPLCTYIQIPSSVETISNSLCYIESVSVHPENPYYAMKDHQLVDLRNNQIIWRPRWLQN